MIALFLVVARVFSVHLWGAVVGVGVFGGGVRLAGLVWVFGGGVLLALLPASGCCAGVVSAGSVICGAVRAWLSGGWERDERRGVSGADGSSGLGAFVAVDAAVLRSSRAVVAALHPPAVGCSASA